MERKIYQDMLRWKQSSYGTSALLIDGARRVGKSYIARAFAEREYRSFIFIDFGRADERYMADTGLLISHAFDESTIVGEDLYNKLLFNKLEVNKGMLVENLVAQMLRANGHKLYFFSTPSEGLAADRMEIDFLIAKSQTTSRHNISPIEVKSSARYALTSLRKFMAKYSEQLATSYVLHSADYKADGGIMFAPLYMAPLL